MDPRQGAVEGAHDHDQDHGDVLAAGGFVSGDDRFDEVPRDRAEVTGMVAHRGGDREVRQPVGSGRHAGARPSDQWRSVSTPLSVTAAVIDRAPSSTKIGESPR
jgi:hypothetical protein